MDFRKIECFIKVAEHLNFSSAADEIHISHQGLSKQIRQLEGELDAALFERSTSYVSLTEIGEKMYELFKPIVWDANNSYKEIQNFIQRKKYVESRLFQWSFIPPSYGYAAEISP